MGLGLQASGLGQRGAFHVVATVIAAALVGGCGYSFSSGGRLPGGAPALAVAPVANRTALADAGGIFEAALRDELAARGKLADGAGVPRLDVELFAVRSAPSGLNFSGAFAYRLDADVRARLRDASGRELMADQLTLGEDYLAGVDVIGTEANRRAALRRLLRNAARELLTRLTAAGRFER